MQPEHFLMFCALYKLISDKLLLIELLVCYVSTLPKFMSLMSYISQKAFLRSSERQKSECISIAEGKKTSQERVTQKSGENNVNVGQNHERQLRVFLKELKHWHVSSW